MLLKNIRVQVFVWRYVSTFLVVYLAVELLGHVGGRMLFKVTQKAGE